MNVYLYFIPYVTIDPFYRISQNEEASKWLKKRKDAGRALSGS